MRKSKILIPFFALFLFIILQIILNIKNPIPLRIEEIELYFSAKTFRQALFSNDIFFQFAKQKGYFLFPLPVVYLTPFTFFSNYLYSIRIPQLIIGFISYSVLFLLIQNILSKNIQINITKYIILFLLILSPWLQGLVLFHLPLTFTLFFLTLAFFTFYKSNKNNFRYINPSLFVFFLLLSALSSWVGLICAFLCPIFIFIAKPGYFHKISRILVFVLLIFLGINIYKNQGFFKTFINEKSFIKQLSPYNLASEINERQRVDYLSSNKKFLLHPLIRKFVYNKPTLALEKTLKQTISFFDFEQYAFPYLSYDINRLSGLPPKGNLPLGYFWDILLIFTGSYFILKKNVKEVFFLLGLSTIPFLVVEKKYMFESSFLTIPLIIYIVSFGLTNIFNNVSKHLKLTTLIIAIFVAGISFFEQNTLIYQKKFDYQTSHLYFFQEISKYIKENGHSFSKIIITNRFGATDLTTSYYLDITPSDYWSAKVNNNSDTVILNNYEFRNITFPNNYTSQNSLFVGFPGEFTKVGKTFNENQIPAELELIDKIVAPDELVYQYGENLWIVKTK